MAVHRYRVGDCFAIPLADGQTAYCHYVNMNSLLGALVRVFNYVGQDIGDIGKLPHFGEMFPPVFVGLGFAVGKGGWRFVGKLPLGDFRFPKFRYTYQHTEGKHLDWQIWDGEQSTRIGSLPPELRSLEMKVVWSSVLLEERISSGRDQVGEGME